MRIGIVNDLTIAAEALRRAVILDPDHQVIWTASDGAQAVALCARDTPDIVLMDLLMPRMDGVEATRQIMASTPCAILIVTASVGANATRVFEAMGHGALDAVDLPSLGSKDFRASAAAMLTKIESIGKVIGGRTVSIKALSDPHEGAGIAPPNSAAAVAVRDHRLVVIGASAGGPAAVAKVLGGLPADFPAAIVIIQHLDARFAPGMANWLGQYCKLRVRLAEEGDRLVGGCVLLAGTAEHLTLKSAERVGYTISPEDCPYRPSVDVFFQSVCRDWTGEAVGVLLTGMGRDGAAGLKALRDKGCHTIAQDRASSAVYGMPKAAASLNAAVDVLPLDEIAPRLVTIFARLSRIRPTAGER